MRVWVLNMMVAVVGGVLVSCGSGKPPFASDTMTVVVGGGEKADQAQALISSVDGLTVDGVEVLGPVACNTVNSRWLVKKTLTLQQPVSAGTKGELTVSGPHGTVTLPVVFSDSMIPKKKSHEAWSKTLEVQCYASVGDKWGLIVFVE